MPFTATWMNLEIIILSEVSQAEKGKYIIYIWNLKNNTNEYTYKTEEDSQTQKTNLRLLGGRDSQGVWEDHVHTAIFKMDNQENDIL